MRIAIVSDIHGNLTALDAVLGDLKQASPDVVLHGGDLADGGSSPAEVIDRIRDLGWQGVAGNTDEMLWSPASLTAFARQSPSLHSLFAMVEDMAAATRETLGEERIAWLRNLPRTHILGPMALVHATPDDVWRSPGPDASDAELESVFGPLGHPVVIYAHIHRAFIRGVPGMTVANTGSASLSYDGDRRAAYLLLDESVPSIRRVEYDVDVEINALVERRLPHADWVARTLRSARPQMP